MPEAVLQNADIVSKYEHSMRDDHMTNTTKYIGDFMVVAGVLFASCMESCHG